MSCRVGRAAACASRERLPSLCAGVYMVDVILVAHTDGSEPGGGKQVILLRAIKMVRYRV